MKQTFSYNAFIFLLLVGFACSDSNKNSDATNNLSEDDKVKAEAELTETKEKLTYYQHAKPIFDAKCSSCHESGGFAPFELKNYENVKKYASLIKYSVTSNYMPPWPPSKECNNYQHDKSLSEDEKKTVLEWIEDGALMGEKPKESDETLTENKSAILNFDIDMKLPEPYSPKPINGKPDDYRCFIIDWPEEKTKYVTGFAVNPDQKEIVHHTIAFVAPKNLADKYKKMDAEEEGPGYTCFGGPAATKLEDAEQEGLGSFSDFSQGLKWLAAWAPGGSNGIFPKGTGIKVEPGSAIILQMHYNVFSASTKPDQSSIKFITKDEVEREAITVPFVNVGWVSQGRLFGSPMTIPAGEKDVYHSTTDIIGNSFSFISRFAQSIGAKSDDTLLMHAVSHHMHTLGKWGKTTLQKGKEETCLLEIKSWDFNWQDNYVFKEPVELNKNDRIKLECRWDNSEENQQIVNGERIKPRDVAWGDGTFDEMCLGVYYITKK